MGIPIGNRACSKMKSQWRLVPANTSRRFARQRHLRLTKKAGQATCRFPNTHCTDLLEAYQRWQRDTPNIQAAPTIERRG